MSACFSIWLVPFIRATGPGSVIVGTLYGLVDGAAAGAVIGWMYNTLAASMKRRS
jgi:hypothetical protein